MKYNRKYVRRHANIGLNAIKSYQNSKLNFKYLIGFLEEVINEIRNENLEIGEKLREHWEDIELINSYALYEIEKGIRKNLNENEKKDIENSLIKIEKILKGLKEYESEEEYIIEKINEAFDD